MAQRIFNAHFSFMCTAAGPKKKKKTTILSLFLAVVSTVVTVFVWMAGAFDFVHWTVCGDSIFLFGGCAQRK